MLLTLNQVISQITTLGAAHLQIQSTGVGDFAEWQALERAYPLLWVFHETTSIGDRELVYSIRLVCADRVITGEEGDDTAGMEQEVLSDTLLILLDFLAYFQQQHAQSYKVITSASIDPFTERFNDRVAGNSVLIQIRQPFTWDACQIPQTGATIPPSVDGLTLYDFCDPSVIARLTPSQVACLEAEYGITCVDATVTQNGNALFTVPAGATYPLVTKLDGANSLGSFNAGTKTLSFTSNPSNLQINGAQSEIIPGNSTFNLLAKLDGVAGGVYNAGLDTINFTTTPAILQRNAIQIKTLANASTFNLITKLDGAANNGAWDGVDTLDFTSAACSPVTFQINAVNKESLSSGSTFNLITKLDGAVNSGTYDAPTDTLSFTSASTPVPSVSLAVSDTTPDFGQTITLTATPIGFVPVRYFCEIRNGTTLIYVGDNATGIFNYTVGTVGSLQVYVYADDGSTVSAFNIGGTATVVAFSPLSLASPVAGYDASDASSVTVATGVSGITNQVGGGLPLVQSSGTLQPAYLIAYKNGLNAIKFDGTNDFLASSAALLSGNDWYISIACRPESTATVQSIFSQFTSGQDGRTTINANQNAGGAVSAGRMLPFTSPSTGLLDFAFTTASHVIEFESVFGVLQVRFNGTVVATGTTAVAIRNEVFRLGSLDGSSAFFSGHFYEMWLFNASQTTANKNALLLYYQNKWNI